MAVCFFSFFLISRRSSLWSIREKTSLDPKCRNFLSKLKFLSSIFLFPFRRNARIPLLPFFSSFFLFRISFRNVRASRYDFLPASSSIKKTYLHSDLANRGVENRGVEKRATREIGRAFPDCKVTRGVTTTRVFSPYTLPPLPASIQRSSIVLLKPASRLPFNGYAKSVDLRQC